MGGHFVFQVNFFIRSCWQFNLSHYPEKKHVNWNLRAVPLWEISQPYTYVHKELSTCMHVFICMDALHKPLQPPYEGPLEVLKGNTKHFTVELNGRTDNIALDHLKPAHVDILLQLQPSGLPPTTHVPVLLTRCPQELDIQDIKFIFQTASWKLFLCHC